MSGRPIITDAAPIMLESLEQAYFGLLSDDERATLATVMRRLRDQAQARLAGQCAELDDEAPQN